MYRKKNGTNAIAPRKQRPVRTKNKLVKQRSSAVANDSNTSSEGGDTPPPRKALPRTSKRKTPPKPAPLDGSEKSSSDNESGFESEVATPVKVLKKTPVKVSKKKPPIALTREATVTLDGDYVVSEIVEGPRSKDGKYLVRWEGYGSDDCTWEPRANLPDDCFGDKDPSSDESGDDQPLHLSVMKPVEDAPPVVAVASPPHKSRMVPVIATRLGIPPPTTLPMTRKRASASRIAI